MSLDLPAPETRVLAVASHVVYGYVGNTMAVFVMQSMGCEVAALNTVHFSNHTGYGQFKGTKTSAQQILDLYEGLQQSYLTDFDVMLSGYAPTADAVNAVGVIARDLKKKAVAQPGSFFWVLDPVMGDAGRLYVNEDVVPAYKKLIPDADLILPNQFELELLSSITITSIPTLIEAILAVHKSYGTPHLIVTSIRLDTTPSTISVIGSTARSDGSPRVFKIEAPDIKCFFSGTGDMFAALMVARLREAAANTSYANVRSWIPGDEVGATELPLAKATEKVVASMQEILEKTKVARDKELSLFEGDLEHADQKRLHLRSTKAAEVRLIRNVASLTSPSRKFRAQPMAG